MADPKNPTPDTDKADKADKARELTKAQAAKLVRRPVAAKRGDGSEVDLVPVAADEVLSFRDYGTHVVVVTVDGQKFSSADTPAKA